MILMLMSIEYRIGCRPSTSARKRRYARFPRARIRYPDNHWMNLGNVHLKFPHVSHSPSPPPVTLSNPMFGCLPFWVPIITHLAPGEWRRSWRLNPEPITSGPPITVLGVYPCGFPFYRSSLRNWPRRFWRSLFWNGKRVGSVHGCIF